MRYFLFSDPQGLLVHITGGESTAEYSAYGGGYALIERGNSFLGHSWAELVALEKSPGYFVDEDE
ncbi:MAG: hypothetical protein ACLQAT_14635 [Candidatus Binataceae bacterium]